MKQKNLTLRQTFAEAMQNYKKKKNFKNLKLYVTKYLVSIPIILNQNYFWQISL